ncbi:hypothetical protein Y032_0049g1804 [Ancylostoma ceylanicum]|uniref:Uncharacterized protein n=1 Tax=Ancylostoma ceylanicum TaxID=53326 RepID=A0A016UAF3_9BILA|nr:hypothetical protein Y032_0049g1804 [Ancylostoma ceylanicum]
MMFMRNGWAADAPFSLNGTTISKCSSYVYPGREVNMMNDLVPELGRRKRAAWRAYKSKHHGSPCFDLRFGNLGVT